MAKVFVKDCDLADCIPIGQKKFGSSIQYNKMLLLSALGSRALEKKFPAYGQGFLGHFISLYFY